MMRQSLVPTSGDTWRTLMKRNALTPPAGSFTTSRTQTPERKSRTLIWLPRAFSRVCCASRSEGGEMTSPSRNVRPTISIPMPSRFISSRRVLMPDTRMIVNSELAASFESA